MPKRFVVLLFILVLTMFLVVACGSTNEEESTEDGAEENANQEDSKNKVENGSASDEEQEDEENGTENTADDDLDDASSSGDGRSVSNKELPDKMAIDERIQHPNGTIVTLESIDFEDDYISVDFVVQNGYDSGIRLGIDDVTLEDDTDFDYSFQPVDLKVGENERMEGTLNFVGRLDDEAESLTLAFNSDGSEKQEDWDSTTHPKIVFSDIEIER